MEKQQDSISISRSNIYLTGKGKKKTIIVLDFIISGYWWCFTSFNFIDCKQEWAKLSETTYVAYNALS